MAAMLTGLPPVKCSARAELSNEAPPLRYDRTSGYLDRHPNYILAAYMAYGT